MKVVLHGEFLSHHPAFANELREEFAGVRFAVTNDLEDLATEIVDADVVYGVPEPEALRVAKSLRWIGCPAVGVDFLMDRSDIVESDVVLTNARGPGYDPHANPLADHVFSMMLLFAHRWRALLEDQRAHRWSFGQHNGTFEELTGRTMGILAVGAIGKAVARRAKGFGMDVYAVDKVLNPVPAGVREVWSPERLDDLMAVSDWLVVAAPLTHETKRMIDARRLALMKPTARVIVISRGGIVDEAALLEAIRSDRLAGAALDVVENEPLAEDSSLWDEERIIISPHTAHVTPEMPPGHREVFKENLRRFLDGRPFVYVCDKRAGY